MTEAQKRNLRELCAAVANENDSTKLGQLYEELMHALDEGKQPPVSLAPDSGKNLQ